MKRITLPKILDSLVHLKEEVVIDPAIAEKARRSVERMVSLKQVARIAFARIDPTAPHRP